ncbi:unnamed protein product [Mytilus coruscus]|uniref:Uncharacterized protein n=1 Tax=Mytilus coruscus TaxID=42192 RepID=A0A6J7ZTH8_MYTCO|nr:unnamed protein product [Mytilus coruscus]
MEILNIKEKEVHAEVTFKSPCSGLISKWEIYILVLNEGIVELDMSGKQLRTIDLGNNQDGILYITATKDGIYCIDCTENKVYCNSMTGENIWTFTNKSLVNVRGISVDGDQNVFVVGRVSKNMMVIQHDGKVSKMLLTESDGLINSWSIHFDKDKKLLLICCGEN